MVAPTGPPLPGCRSGYAATRIIPGSPATLSSWRSASPSSQVALVAKIRIVSDVVMAVFHPSAKRSESWFFNMREDPIVILPELCDSLGRIASEDEKMPGRWAGHGFFHPRRCTAGEHGGKGQSLAYHFRQTLNQRRMITNSALPHFSHYLGKRLDQAHLFPLQEYPQGPDDRQSLFIAENHHRRDVSRSKSS